MKLPKVIYATVQEGRNGSTWLNSGKTAAAVIEGDGPTVIGKYELVEMSELKKAAVVLSRKPRRRRS